MARIFISYSRADRAFVEELVPLLRQVLPEYDVWYDDQISGGEDWWRRILVEIGLCDLFVYLLSNDSLESPYCQAEFREALRLRKACLPVIVRPKTDVGRTAPELATVIRTLQWIDLGEGFKNPRANAKLYAAIRKLLSEVTAFPPWPLSPVPVLEPEMVETERKKPRRGSTAYQMAGFAVVTALVAVLGLLVIKALTDARNQAAPPPPATAAAVGATATETPSPTPTGTPTPTATLKMDQIVATLNAQSTLDWATQFANETAAAGATAQAVGTIAVLDQTATAAAWTDTPTPDITASIDAYRTRQAATPTAQAVTATAAAWTEPPALSPTGTLLPIPEGVQAALQAAAGFTGGNTDWAPFAHAFPDDPAGAEMALVPVGRFIMGSRDGADNERPEHAQTIAAPYWIDRTEVTRGQYARCVAAGACTETPDNAHSQRDTQPINRVTWFQARDYCAWRGKRLPTEVEWEYAARGPSARVYPWGDGWHAANAIYQGNSGNVPADVGSRPMDISWVGALDLGGNLSEWVNSLHADYPYDATRENSSDVYGYRVIRGGSFASNALNLRLSHRDWRYPGYEYYTVGFRCARP